MRAGYFPEDYWSPEIARNREGLINHGAHVDDFFLSPIIRFHFVAGQPTLHYPGDYTLDVGKLLDMGVEVPNAFKRTWESAKDYVELAKDAYFDDTGMGRKIIMSIIDQQIEIHGIEPQECPVGQIYVGDSFFVHSENDHSEAVGEYRGILLRWGYLYPIND